MGGGGKAQGGSSIDPELSQSYYDTAYDLGLSGGEFASDAEGDYAPYGRQGYAAGKSQFDINTKLETEKADRETREAEQTAQREQDTIDREEDERQRTEQRAEEQRIATGKRDRDSAYQRYLSASETSIAAADQDFAAEEANARLRGVEFNLTDELRQQRIGDYLAQNWTEADQTGLQGLINSFGAPEGFSGFMERGDASRITTDAEKTLVGRTRTLQPLVDDDEEEDEVLGSGLTLLT